MKNIIKIILLLSLTLNCKAQSPVFDIEDIPNIIKDIYGHYQKDTNNQLNAFEGNYIYANGNDTIQLVLQKKILSSMNNYYYEDLIIGEYKYVKNGIVKTNTLNKLNLSYTDQSNHSIDGNFLLTGTEKGCDDCLPNEKRLEVGIVDNNSNNTGYAHIRRILVNGQQAIKFLIVWRMGYRSPSDLPPTYYSIPGGDFILIKQP